MEDRQQLNELKYGIADVGGKMPGAATPMRELPWRLSSGFQTVMARLPGM